MFRFVSEEAGENLALYKYFALLIQSLTVTIEDRQIIALSKFAQRVLDLIPSNANDSMNIHLVVLVS